MQGRDVSGFLDPDPQNLNTNSKDALRLCKTDGGLPREGTLWHLSSLLSSLHVEHLQQHTGVSHLLNLLTAAGSSYHH